MAKDPAILFYTSDFLTGTMFMSDEQIGQYMRLLCAQHQNGRLSEKHILSICKSRDDEVFSKFIKDSDGLYYNERMEMEIIRRKKYTESRRNNAKGKKKIIKKSSKSCVKHMERHMENENINENKDSIINKGENSENEKTFKFHPPKWDAVEDITRSVEEKHLTEPQRKERIKNIRVEFTTPGMNFDSIMRAINLSENDTIEILNSFVDHIASTGEYCNPLKQLKIHCTNWIKKQINDKEKSNSKKSWSENVGTLGQGIIDEDEHNLSANQGGPTQGCDTTVP